MEWELHKITAGIFVTVIGGILVFYITNSVGTGSIGGWESIPVENKESNEPQKMADSNAITGERGVPLVTNKNDLLPNLRVSDIRFYLDLDWRKRNRGRSGRSANFNYLPVNERIYASSFGVDYSEIICSEVDMSHPQISTVLKGKMTIELSRKSFLIYEDVGIYHSGSWDFNFSTSPKSSYEFCFSRARGRQVRGKYRITYFIDGWPLAYAWFRIN